MARIARKNQKIFAENASNNGVFGSLQANDPTHSNDPDVIQGRTAYSNGWNDATYSSELLPPLEEFQALQYLFSRQLSYLFQEGIAEWNSSTTYYKGSIAKAISGTIVRLYISIVDNNTNHLVTDTTRWTCFFDSSLGYADVGLTNLNSTGKNIGNWSTNVTNCITEIPQDINLELSSGTLTLKAGSKVYVPNGVGIFNTVTISNDISNSGNANKSLVTFKDNSIFWTNITISSPVEPANPSNGMLWYDITNNIIKRYSNSSWISGFSLPLAVLNPNAVSSTTITESLPFNGFGYIGSTVFALPGIKGLIPNGRNADGTLKNILFTLGNVRVNTFASNQENSKFVVATTGNGASVNYIYNEEKNAIDYGTTVYNDRFIAGTFTVSGGQITEFNPKQAFNAVDYNDFIHKADINSPAFTGTPTAPTPSSATDNSTNIATTAWVNSHLSNATTKSTITGWGVPNYASAVTITSPYTPAKNGIIIVKAVGGYCTCDISKGSTVISRNQSGDSSSTTNAVWAIVKSGEQYTVRATGTATLLFVPFVGG